jgi:hypothetical protein
MGTPPNSIHRGAKDHGERHLGGLREKESAGEDYIQEKLWTEKGRGGVRRRGLRGSDERVRAWRMDVTDRRWRRDGTETGR